MPGFRAYLMKKSILAIAFMLCISNIRAQANDSLIFFTQSLEWDSFKGTPDSDTLGARISTVINLKIRVNAWSGKPHFKSYALMDPYKSWVAPGYADPYTLRHEQTHFNITELCARKLQAELNQLKLKATITVLIEAILTKWENQMEAMQRQYDLETKGGNDPVSQNSWNEKITGGLNTND